MIPVTIVRTENYPGFLLSFNNITWWKSQPIRDSIESVLQVIWVYGQYHVCSVKMSNGTYSIYQSKDNGYSWTSVLNTSENINTLFCPDYGIAMFASSAGWWRSIDSGSNWSKISTQAPNCFCAKSIGSNILVAMSLHDIWRSTNGGVTWSQVFSTGYDIIYPSLDGTIYDCIAGINGKIYYSSNAGVSFNNSNIEGFTGLSTPITNIVMTSMFGGNDKKTGSTNVPTFMVQRLDSEGYLNHYYLVRTPGSTSRMFAAYYRFSAQNSISNSLIANEFQVTGESTIGRMVFFSGTDKLGTSPIIKTSTDCGWTWTTNNVSSAIIYDGPDLSQVSEGGGPIVGETYFSASWQHNANCHNYWHVYGTHYEKNQSYDIDFITKPAVPLTKSYLEDIFIANNLESLINFDILLKSINIKNSIFNILNKKDDYHSYIVGMMNRIAFTGKYDLDILVTNRNNINIAIDENIEKTCFALLYPKCYIIDNDQKTYSIGMSLIDNHVNQIMNQIERYTPQAPDIRYLNIPYNVWDSRKEGVTL